MEISSFIRYLEVERNFSPHTITAYQNDLEQFSAFMQREFETVQPENVQPGFIRSWVVDMMEKEIHPNSISRKISSIKSWYKYLLRMGVVKKNPAFKVILPKKPRRLPKFIDKDGLDSLLDKSFFPADFRGSRDRLIIELFYFTGMREAELIGLKTTDLDYYNLHIKVLGKRNKERLIPLTEAFAAQLMGFIDHPDRLKEVDNDYLFLTDKGKKLYPKFVYNLVNHYLSMVANVTQKSPHILRHSFATHMLNNGADINAVKSILGHESLAATQVYTHNTIEKLKSVHKQAHPRG